MQEAGQFWKALKEEQARIPTLITRAIEDRNYELLATLSGLPQVVS